MSKLQSAIFVIIRKEEKTCSNERRSKSFGHLLDLPIYRGKKTWANYRLPAILLHTIFLGETKNAAENILIFASASVSENAGLRLLPTPLKDNSLETISFVLCDEPDPRKRNRLFEDVGSVIKIMLFYEDYACKLDLENTWVF